MSSEAPRTCRNTSVARKSEATQLFNMLISQAPKLEASNKWNWFIMHTAQLTYIYMCNKHDSWFKLICRSEIAFPMNLVALRWVTTIDYLSAGSIIPVPMLLDVAGKRIDKLFTSIGFYMYCIILLICTGRKRLYAFVHKPLCFFFPFLRDSLTTVYPLKI